MLMNNKLVWLRISLLLPTWPGFLSFLFFLFLPTGRNSDVGRGRVALGVRRHPVLGKRTSALLTRLFFFFFLFSGRRNSGRKEKRKEGTAVPSK